MIDIVPYIDAHSQSCTLSTCQKQGRPGTDACRKKIRGHINETIGAQKADDIFLEEAATAVVKLGRGICMWDYIKARADETGKRVKRSIESAK